jgi:two-component system, NarL family, response regulator DesR
MIRVPLAEDVHMVRGALVALLELEPDLEVVAQVGAGQEIVPMAQRVQPDVAVLDIDLPGTGTGPAVVALLAASQLPRRLRTPAPA